MAEFYDNPDVFVVQPEKESKKKGNYWNILNAGAVKLAVMHHRKDPFWVRCLRLLGLTQGLPTRITIESHTGHPLLHLRRGLSLGMFRAGVYDGEGRKLGEVSESRYGLEGRNYQMVDNRGHPLGKLQGDWRSYNLQLYDAEGNLIGKIGRKSEAVNKVLFPHRDYYVVQLYVPQEDETARKVLLGTSAAIELLLR